MADAGRVDLTIAVDNRAALAGLDQTRRSIEQTGQAVERLNRSGSGGPPFDDLTNSANRAGASLQALNGVLAIGARAVAGYLTIETVRQISDVGVAAESAEVRLKSLAGRFGEADQALRASADAALLLNLSQTEAASGFTRLYASLRPVGVGLEDINTIFVGVSAAAKNVGLSTDDATGTIFQLAQALGSGRLQGDELVRVLENLPPLAQAIATQMKVRVGELKKLGSEGKITSDIIISALKRLKSQEVGQLNKSLGTSQEKLKTLSVEAQNFQKELSTAFGAPALATVGALTNAFKGLADAIRQANIANQYPELAKRADRQASDLVQAKLGPFGGSGFFGGVSVQYGGKTYSGTATGVRNDLVKAILGQLIKELGGGGGGGGGGGNTPTAPALPSPAVASALNASKVRLDDLQRTAGLEGSALQLLQQQLAVEKALTEQRRLQAEYDKASKAASDAGGKDAAKNTAAADAESRLKAASMNVRSAFIEGSRSAADILKGAAERFKAAGQALRGSLEGAFQFLRPDIQNKLTERARADISAAQKAGIFRGDVGLNSTPEELLSIAGSARSVLTATADFNKAGTDLNSAIDQLSSPLLELSKKDWTVVVNVASSGLASVSGDAVLGG